MKSLFLILVFLFCEIVFSQNGLRFSEKEFFTASISISPVASIKEEGADFVGEIEYSGFVYTKAGFESFSALYGGYWDVHGAIGMSLTSGLFEKTRFYSGIRLARVGRGHEGAWRPMFGLEGGVELNLTDNFFVGIRVTYDKRDDQEIFGLSREMKASGFFRFGYKWYYKNY
ncbi:hypothetical protein CLU81_0575 [Flavobacterium sp. 9]|uniref:hypothetical protein n=1 Tax=Flavobacterium sp. 9 TaxID=2035198 RepID=UPI000C18E7A2|nr:hypothetical protein [Flavobacterium sp. 9]PIF30167.1 hypothetical protein CLU81_0575 [Flavobacterium sp. 9]